MAQDNGVASLITLVIAVFGIYLLYRLFSPPKGDENASAAVSSKAEPMLIDQRSISPASRAAVAAAQNQARLPRDEATEHPPSLPQKMKASGSNGVLYLDGDQVVIERRPGMANLILQGLQGDKVIPLISISAVQFRRAGSAIVGYIQFTIPGVAQRAGGVLDMTKDENAVLFTRDQEPQFLSIREEIQRRMADARKAPVSPAYSTPAAIHSAADELEKLISMVERGYLTREEFEDRKKKLLST